MRNRLVVALIAIWPAVAATADELLFRESFSAFGPREEQRAWRGEFRGVLVPGLKPDFLQRCESRATSEPGEENGMKFLRVKTEVEKSWFIFSGSSLPGLKPGFYRLVVRGRAVTNPLAVELKTVRWVGEWFGSVHLGAPEWTEQSDVFHVTKEIREPVAVSLAFNVGEADVATVELYRTDETEFAAKFRRPSKGCANLFARRHFALGLPSGWSSVGARWRTEGTAIVNSGSGSFSVYSAPFQTDDPKEPCTVRFRYRAGGPVRASIREYNGKVAHEQILGAESDWAQAEVRFSPNPYTDAFTLCFEGVGPLSLNDIEAWSGEKHPLVDDDQCELYLAPLGGVIGESNRIQFLDERPQARFLVLGAPSGARVRLFVGDLYGVEREIAIDGLSGEFGWGVFGGRPIGSFRIWGWVESGGRRISSCSELVMTRVPRPAAWGRDAPHSHFGAHFPPREELIWAMKAAGVNWTRFHDSCTELSGWYAIEPEKGKWRWPDEQIRVFRENGVKIYAQLGTTPPWASHFGEMGLKSFGYFEKFMRPTNSVDWVNYVTNYVCHYDGIIGDYFVWNEPWYRWWMSAPDAKYYDAKKAGHDFGVLCSQAYEAAKSVNPSVNICGFNTSPDGGRWAKQVMTGGAYESCDQMEFHYYANLPRCRKGLDSNISEFALGAVREAHPDCKKPIYLTEGGANMSGKASGLYRETVPWTAEAKDEYVRNADNTVRFAVSFLAEGVERIFIYTMHSYRALGIRNPFLKLLTSDGYPHPAFVAHAVMAAKLDGKRFAEKRDYGKNGLAYVFKGPDGDTCVVLAGLSAEEVFALLGSSRRTLFDIFGNRVTRETFLPGTLIYAE